MTSFNCALTQRPNESTKLEIAQTLFGPGLQAKDLLWLNSYFAYYERELALLNLGKPAPIRQQTDLATATHNDILFIVHELRINRHLTKSEFRDRLQTRFQNVDTLALDRSIDLSLRLWMMVNVREPRIRLQTPQTPALKWTDDSSFETFVTDAFPRSRWKIGAKDSRLHPAFTAAFMAEICGLRLEWTDCLADHLRLDRKQKAPVLRVYHHKNFLRFYLESSSLSVTGASQNPIPETVLAETIQSLNLLFPQWDPATNKLLKAHKQNFQQQGPYEGPPTLNLMEFDHFRDRLLEVYDVIFQSPPVSWAQLWRDRRNPQQFWTFWIALFILLLTLISTATSIVQTWASVKSANALPT